MAKSYNGLDRTEAFFAHYGRKGMKRGMNIYNPDYKPVGEKAQGSSLTSRIRSHNSAYVTQQDKERQAMNSAARASSVQGTKSKQERTEKAEKLLQSTSGTAANEASKYQKSAREKLLEGERRRQAAKHEKSQSERESDAMTAAAKKATELGNRTRAKDDAYKESVQSSYMEDLRGLKAVGGLIINSDPEATHTNQHLNGLLQDAQKALEAVRDAKLSGDKEAILDADYNYRTELAAFMKAYMKAMGNRVAGGKQIYK